MNAALARACGPAALKPSAAWPWPLTAIDGIQYQATGPVCALPGVLSNTVPDCATAGVVVMFCSSYQRTPLRAVTVCAPPLGIATPVSSTRKLCAVHRRPLRICAAYRRSSRPSSCPSAEPLPPLLPRCGTSPA